MGCRDCFGGPAATFFLETGKWGLHPSVLEGNDPLDLELFSSMFALNFITIHLLRFPIQRCPAGSHTFCLFSYVCTDVLLLKGMVLL